MNRSRRRLLSAACGAVVASAVLVGGSTPALAEGRPGRPPGMPADVLAADLAKVTEAGMPGVLAQARDGRGAWNGASGVADVDTGRPMQPHMRHRVGSVTKTFMAATVLQLVGERRVALDAPVARYLPDLAPSGVTVRMLLNHTSGIGTYDAVLFSTPEGVEEHRDSTFSPRQLARIGLDMPRTGAPGEGFSYSNTNYVLAGLVVEKVTGRSATEEITRRIIKPLGLRHTVFPGTKPRITGPHSKGYLPWHESVLRDFSVYNMSWAWTAGELVSTTDDLNRFYRALLSGKVLGAKELREMQRTVSVGPDQIVDGYGLGIYRINLPCGPAWGHDGVVFGYSTMSLHSPDGTRQVTIADNVTHYGVPGQPDPILEAKLGFVVTALCGPAASSGSAEKLRSAAAPLTLPVTAPGTTDLIRPLPPR
ncbi:serine hydrolase domain-containing protein [Micromonospora sp. SH-82]|uniref:serine hydrolase domain-containing protein n=1 Tax=Micromonospora sp. SH-82 TaxID=3132938 RepID=UPI003EB72591